MAAHRPGCYRGIGAKLELAGEQILQAILVHNQHNQIDSLTADLEAKATAAGENERRGTPSRGSPATGHAPAVAGSHDESSLQERWHDGDALRGRYNLLGNPCIRRGLNL